MTLVWHRVLRLVTCFSAITLQLAFGVPLTILNIAAIGSLFQGEFELGEPAPFQGYWLGVAMLVVVLPLITGAWLTVGFSHLRRGAVFIGWAGLLAFNLLLIGVILGLTDSLDGISGSTFDAMSYSQRAWSGVTGMFFPCLGILAGMMLMTAGGIPVGHVVLRLGRLIKRRQWRWMLRRRRLRRSAE